MTEDKFVQLSIARAIKLEQDIARDFNMPMAEGVVHTPSPASVELAAKQIAAEWIEVVADVQRQLDAKKKADEVKLLSQQGTGE